MSDHSHHNSASAPSSHYGRLSVMLVLSFVAMYALMYSMVNVFGNVYANVNQLYMAGLMTAAMLVIEVTIMGSMYPKRRLNMVLIGAGLLGAIASWQGTRQQWAVGDRQFLRSMIPHHAGAILMCQRSEIRQQDIRALCEGIVTSQQAEIDQMKGLLGDH